MIHILKLTWDYRMSLLELIVRNIARYPQSATSTSIHYQPAIRYLLPCAYRFTTSTSFLDTDDYKSLRNKIGTGGNIFIFSIRLRLQGMCIFRWDWACVQSAAPGGLLLAAFAIYENREKLHMCSDSRNLREISIFYLDSITGNEFISLSRWFFCEESVSCTTI